MRRRIVLFAAVFAAVSVLGVLAWIAARGDTRRLTVSGEAVVEVTPDRARLSLGVEADGPTAGAAQADAARRMTAVLEALRRSGVPEKEIRTGTVSLNPVRRYDPKDGRETLHGYRAANRIEVTLDQPEKAGEILDAGVAAGADTAGEVRFYLDDAASARDEALAEAFADAKRRAASLAASSGLRLGKAMAVDEETSTPLWTQDVAMRSTAKPGTGAPVPIEPGEVAVRALVRVVFEAR